MNIVDLLKDPNKTREILEDAINKKNKELAEALIPIVKNPWLVERYAERIVKGRVKEEWEDIIIQNTHVTHMYVAKIIKGPWPKGEEAIASDHINALNYAENILKGPFPKGEEVISHFATESYLYARKILKDRFIKGEKIIISDLLYLTDYVNFLKEINKLNEFLKDHPEVKL